MKLLLSFLILSNLSAQGAGALLPPKKLDIKFLGDSRIYRCSFSHHSPGLPPLPFELHAEDYAKAEILANKAKELAKSDNYLCVYGEEKVLVQKNEIGWLALGRRGNGDLEMKDIYQVSDSEGGIIFADSNSALHIAKFDSQDPSITSTLSRYLAIKAYIYHGENTIYSADKNSPVSAPFESTMKEFLSQLEQQSKELKGNLQLNTVQMALRGGYKTKCIRGEPASCELFYCEPVKIGANNYTPLLFMSSEGNRHPIASQSSDTELGRIEVPDKIIPMGQNQADRDLFMASDEDAERYKFGPLDESSLKPSLPSQFMMNNWIRINVYPDFKEMRDELRSACDKGKVLDLLDHENALLEKAKQALYLEKLIVFVQKENHALSAEIEPIANLEKSNIWHEGGDVYYSAEAAVDRKQSQLLQAENAVSEKTAKELFSWLSKMKDIPFGYVQDGCFARAQVMAERMIRLRGVVSDKVWALDGILQANDTIRWDYHVAPVVLVKQASGAMQRMVLDPSLAKGPLSVEAWLALFHNDLKGKAIDLYDLNPFQEHLNSGPYYQRTLIFYTPWYIYEANREFGMVSAAQRKLDLEDAYSVLKKYSQ